MHLIIKKTIIITYLSTLNKQAKQPQDFQQADQRYRKSLILEVRNYRNHPELLNNIQTIQVALYGGFVENRRFSQDFHVDRRA